MSADPAGGLLDSSGVFSLNLGSSLSQGRLIYPGLGMYPGKESCVAVESYSQGGAKMGSTQ